MIIDGQQQQQNVELSCDVVIIGSGAGGSVLAKELSEAGQSVVLIDEGGHHSASSHRDLPFQAIKRLYQNHGMTSTIGRPAVPLPLGRALGGTTVINSGTCFRTPDKIFKHWQEHFDLKHLNKETFTPYFERVEKIIHASPCQFDTMGASNLLFHKFLKQHWPEGKPLVRNAKNCDGRGYCCYGCPTGAEQSMDQNYLPQASALGAQIFAHTRLHYFLKEKGGRINGITATFVNRQGKPGLYQLTVHAEKTIVCAGAIATPSILKANGIARFNRHLGKHLSLHPATKVYAKMSEDIWGWEGTPQAYYSNVLEHDGVMFEGIFVPPDVAAMTAPFVGPNLVEFMKNYSKIASFGFMIEGESEGQIYNLPLVGRQIFYQLNQNDADKFKKGVIFLTRLFLEGGAEKIMTLIHGHTTINSLDRLEKLEKAKIRPWDIECMAFRPLGTCRMGMSDKNGVVGPDFQVFGHENLYVCDGSVIPSSLGVNPQVSIMSFATHCAELMKQKRGWA